ncbi:MAG: hypothetical protein WBP11_12700 [Dokdonella sp.]
MADDTHSFDSDTNLGARLRALPAHAPSADLWQSLSARLPPVATRPQRRRWHPAVSIALAASLLVAALLPWTTQQSSTVLQPEPAATLSPQASAGLVWLKSRSSQLETWLAQLPSASMHGGRELMATIEVEDLIGLVDLQLNATTNAAEALPLWRRRVALLENLSLLRAAALNTGAAVAENNAGATSINHL